ncbi:hypothetical protein [Sporolactobacillus laevolacticus]|uniref:Uncharacterized protein n=1 Tax=Sporolactobacillus laevolacticus DSM 442 TaxID=1395513 RepID=V6IZ63_9BACL|nr:hypothetical protein [Sporolactobacillus laevolacticus]EST12730.1 hypothetical protein P343_04950 [Sporolactobacillus laevolacticus DSM 442]
MKPYELALKLLDLSEKNWFDYSQKERANLESEYNHLIELFIKSIKSESDRAVIQSIIELEKKKLFLPTNCLINLYKQALSLSDEKIELLNEFLSFLDLYSPDWDVEVDNIKNALKNRSITDAYDLAMHVSETKDFC